MSNNDVHAVVVPLKRSRVQGVAQDGPQTADAGAGFRGSRLRRRAQVHQRCVPEVETHDMNLCRRVRGQKQFNSIFFNQVYEFVGLHLFWLCKEIFVSTFCAFNNTKHTIILINVAILLGFKNRFVNTVSLIYFGITN